MVPTFINHKLNTSACWPPETKQYLWDCTFNLCTCTMPRKRGCIPRQWGAGETGLKRSRSDVWERVGPEPMWVMNLWKSGISAGVCLRWYGVPGHDNRGPKYNWTFCVHTCPSPLFLAWNSTEKADYIKSSLKWPDGSMAV
jgi:hypothetical protein